MNKKLVSSLMVFFVVLIFGGCGSKQLVTTGFLSDYSRLGMDSKSSMRYVNPRNGLGNYSKFIVEPVVIHFHAKAKGKETKREELVNLKKYMYDSVVKALSGRYQIVNQAGTKVARLRIALTDIEKSSPVLNAIPQTKLSGLGLGSASMEAELIDSLSGEQIGAIVESQEGKRLSLEGLTKWGDAKAVMDGWAKRFRERLDEAHGF